MAHRLRRALTPHQTKLSLLPGAQENILQQQEGKEKLNKAVADLSHAFALAVPHEDAIRIRDDVGFFQAVKSVLSKTPTKRPQSAASQAAIRQIVSNAFITQDVVDIFAAAGLKKLEISIFSEEFLEEIPKDELKTRTSRNIVLTRKFSELIENSLRRCQNRAIETARVIEELLAVAKNLREAAERGTALGLNDDELAFYDALEVNDSAVKVLGDPSLRLIARELAEYVRKNVTIDWTQRENVGAKLRVIVKRILKKHGYPPDKQERATQTVLEGSLAGEIPTRIRTTHE